MRNQRKAWSLLLFAGFAAAARAEDCGALKNLQLPETTITSAQTVTSGSLQGNELPRPMHGLPEFCRVTGVLRPSSDSSIGFEVWLPTHGWNGRFLGVGNGGFAGSIGYDGLAGNLKRGFATAGSDAGHKADGEDASWAYQHPEKIKDFGWRAVHLTAERSKAVINAYYGKNADKAYFDSCSDGGREALMEAQRFPKDYDGILAGAPANNWVHLISSGVDVAQSTIGNPRSYVSSQKLPAIQRASLAACDAQDGVQDGFINDPAQCHFDPAVLLCKEGDALDCLTQPQVESVKKYYAGGKIGNAPPPFPGFTMGDEESWKEWVVGSGPGSGSGIQYVQNYFRYMVFSDPKWNVLTADPEASLQAAVKTTAAELDATNPDLKEFEAHGGKLLMYHGWNDQAISPWNSVSYYHDVQKKMGEAKTDTFMRLYMVPGMEHCLAGPGPNSFGQLGFPTTGDNKYGIFDALVGWVEKDTKPTSIIATKYRQGKNGESQAVMTRPLCAYPMLAKYKGTGDTNDAANFTCEKP